MALLLARPAPITLIGITGVGKSTTGNCLVGTTAFVTSAGIDSETTVVQKGAGNDLEIYDTPGLLDTKMRSQAFFQEITTHLHDVGGIILLVHNDDRLKDATFRNVLNALFICGGESLAANTYLVRTNPSFDVNALAQAVDGRKWDGKESKESVAVRWLIYVKGCIEAELQFPLAGVYGWHPELQLWSDVEQFRTTVKQWAEEGGIQPGRVQTWESVLKALRNDVATRFEVVAEAKAAMLNDIKEAKRMIDWKERSIRDMRISTVALGWIPVVGQIIAGSLDIAEEDVRRSIRCLQQKISGMERELADIESGHLAKAAEQAQKKAEAVMKLIDGQGSVFQHDEPNCQ